MLEMKLITKRFDKINPLKIEDFINNDGYKMLEKALKMDHLDIIDEIEASNIRGRGGAGFPAAIKLKALAKEARNPKYVVCNADEGEPGNFKDRHLMEKDPHGILEGMIICGYATNAAKGYIYVRGEYNKSQNTLKEAIKQAKEKGYLGTNILNSGFNFDIEVRSGAGSYVCGEEFSLLESLEGKAGRTRVKPPFPTTRGLFGQPTLINNVETFATIPVIIDMGGAEYKKIGTATSTGTKLISLSGHIKNKGVYEVPYGTPMRKIIDELGGGMLNGNKLKMAQLGGACGPIIPEYLLDMIIDYDRFEEFESKTGAGAIIVMDESVDVFNVLIRIAEFFAHESCGKCIPCREGTLHLIKQLEKFVNYEATMDDLIQLESKALVIHQSALCGLGQSAPTAIISTLRYFRGEFIKRIEESEAKESE